MVHELIRKWTSRAMGEEKLLDLAKKHLDVGDATGPEKMFWSDKIDEYHRSCQTICDFVEDLKRLAGGK